MNNKIFEWGNNGHSMGGGFVGGGDLSVNSGKIKRSKFYSEPITHADTTFSRNLGTSSSKFKGSYYEDLKQDNDGEDEILNDILEYRVYYNKKFHLLATLNNLSESNNKNVTIGQLRIKNAELKDQREKILTDLSKDTLDEFSGAGAIGGFSLPLGAKPEDYNFKTKKIKNKTNKL